MVISTIRVNSNNEEKHRNSLELRCFTWCVIRGSNPGHPD
nr:MAG TPA: hypothetical protein [Caudoviricetes sp.]